MRTFPWTRLERAAFEDVVIDQIEECRGFIMKLNWLIEQSASVRRLLAHRKRWIIQRRRMEEEIGFLKILREDLRGLRLAETYVDRRD